MSVTHTLKTVACYYEAVEDGRKPFDVRLNDRAFQTGDIVELLKVDALGVPVLHGGMPLPVQISLKRRITYILQGGHFGIEPRYCVLGLGAVN
jgi:hypothetical protein